MHSVTRAMIIAVAPTLYATRQPVHQQGMVRARRERFAASRLTAFFVYSPFVKKGQMFRGGLLLTCPIMPLLQSVCARNRSAACIIAASNRLFAHRLRRRAMLLPPEKRIRKKLCARPSANWT